jgi:SnoaL-like protein
MSKIRIRIAMAIACVMAFTLASITVVAQDNSAREKDRAEIEELMWRYTRALDTGDGAAYAAAYTADGQFGTGANATKGTEALKKLGETLKPKPGAAARAPLYHMETNQWIEFIDKDHARHHAYYITVSGAGPDNAQPRIVAAGRSVDHLERVNGKWLIKLRDVSPKD